MSSFSSDFENIKSLLENGSYSDAIEVLHKNTFNCDIFMRENWIIKFKSWALPPSLEQLEKIYKIVEGSTILEVGSGAGLWSAILKSRGLKVIATDSKCEPLPDSWINLFDTSPVTNNVNCRKEYLDVEKLTASDALEKYGATSDVLLVCWGRNFISEADFRKFKGKYVISIGEPPGGCTNNGYVDKLDHNESWEVFECVNIPKWDCIKDELVIYQKK